MRRWAGIVAVLLSASACATGSSPGAPSGAASSPASASTDSSRAALPTVRGPADPVPGLEAEAVQLRTDGAVGGRIQVRITASDSFAVTSVALDSPGFERLPPGRCPATSCPAG